MKRNASSIAAIAVFLLAILSCQLFSAKPSSTIKKFYRHVEAGELDDAMALLSRSSAVATIGPAKVKAGLAEQTAAIKKKRGIASIDIQDEQINGETAVVKGSVKFNDGSSDSFEGGLIKEDGAWKIAK